MSSIFPMNCLLGLAGVRRYHKTEAGKDVGKRRAGKGCLYISNLVDFGVENLFIFASFIYVSTAQLYL